MKFLLYPNKESFNEEQQCLKHSVTVPTPMADPRPPGIGGLVGLCWLVNIKWHSHKLSLEQYPPKILSSYPNIYIELLTLSQSVHIFLKTSFLRIKHLIIYQVLGNKIDTDMY